MKTLRRNREHLRFCKWAIASVFGLLIFCMAGFTGLAARVGTVRTNNANVRTEASADSERVCQLSADTTVNIIEDAQGSDGNTWYHVSFTLDGSDREGWIRSDILEVSEVEDAPEEEPDSSAGGYSIQEPLEAYAGSDALTQTGIQVGEDTFTAWQVSTDLTGGQQLYLVYAASPDGGSGWFYYDPQGNTFQRDMGQFSGGGSDREGLVEALQEELADRKEEYEQQISRRLYIIIGLGVLSAILLILVIVFALKYRNAAYEYYDDEEEDEDERDQGRRKAAKHYEDEGFDDFVKAVKKKWAEPDDDDEYEDEYEDEYDDDETEEDDWDDSLPDIDMSAVLEVEKEAGALGSSKSQGGEDDEELDDFDIEILDFEDLGL